MDMCIIQLEMKHCEVGGCQGPSYTNIGVFKNKKQAKQFMKKDKVFKNALVHEILKKVCGQ